MSSARRRDPQATKAKILRAASQEFARLGYAGARGDRIAKRAGCSERMVYYYYGNKEALFRAVLESAYTTLREAERALQLDELPPLQALDRFCRFVWRYYLDHPEFIGLVNTENLHKGKHLRASGQLNELVSPILGLLERLLQRGANAAQFRADIDAAELYIAIAAQGYFYLSNQHTLSAVLGRNLRDDTHLQRHWQVSAELIRRFVAVTMPP